MHSIELCVFLKYYELILGSSIFPPVYGSIRGTRISASGNHITCFWSVLPNKSNNSYLPSVLWAFYHHASDACFLLQNPSPRRSCSPWLTAPLNLLSFPFPLFLLWSPPGRAPALAPTLHLSSVTPGLLSVAEKTSQPPFTQHPGACGNCRISALPQAHWVQICGLTGSPGDSNAY